MNEQDPEIEPLPSEEEHRVAVLCALYSADRADCSSIYNAAFALVGFALTYSAAALAYFKCRR